MKQNTIAAITAAVILLVWQALSWMALPLHNDTFKYAPQQTEILSTLSSRLPEAGAYSLPGMNPDSKLSHEQMEEQGKEYIGKPWALVFYNQSFKGMTTANLLCGFLFNLLSVIIAICLLRATGIREKTFGTRFGIVMLLSIFCILQSVLVSWNWWSFPWHFIKGEIADLLIGWGLCGLFLAWYLGRTGTVRA